MDGRQIVIGDMVTTAATTAELKNALPGVKLHENIFLKDVIQKLEAFDMPAEATKFKVMKLSAERNPLTQWFDYTAFTTTVPFGPAVPGLLLEIFKDVKQTEATILIMQTEDEINPYVQCCIYRDGDTIMCIAGERGDKLTHVTVYNWIGVKDKYSYTN